MDIKQAQAVSQRLREDYLAVARPFGEKAADIIDALIEEVERCDEEYNKVLAEKEAHAQEDIKRLHRIEQKVDALIVERDALRAQLVKQLVKANTEPDWKDSDTLPSEGWKNPLYDFQTRLQFADGAISFRDKVIANLRQQLVRAQDNNEFAPPGGGYLHPTPTPERAPAQRAIATDDPEIYEFWARNKESEKQEPAKYSDIVSDGGMDSRNKFDAAPVQEPVAVHQYRVPLCSDWYDGIPDHHDGHGPYEVRTLYTTPPAAQRQWVGLTLADREELRDQFEDWNYPAILVDVISAKLKEKNT